MVFETINQFMSKLMLFHGYVNEFNGFPNPLSKEEEDFYIEEMKKGNEAAKEKLINHRKYWETVPARIQSGICSCLPQIHCSSLYPSYHTLN